MSQYGLVEPRRGESGVLEAHVSSDQARLGISSTGVAREGAGSGP